MDLITEINSTSPNPARNTVQPKGETKTRFTGIMTKEQFVILVLLPMGLILMISLPLISIALGSTSISPVQLKRLSNT